MKNQPSIEACRKFSFRNTPETLRYFYHPDHIGSTSWVTDSAKNGIQYCEYLPFGEPFLDQRSTTWNSRYTFSGKERDGETGYSYFGARYYNSDLSIWRSVDPMADKYPNLTPYAYCANNPIVLVDPDGRDIVNNLDWIKNLKTGQYEWNDNVTSPENTPDGYKYIGSNNNDILTDLNLISDTQRQDATRVGFGLSGDESTGKAAPLASASKITGILNISAIVSYNLKNRTSSNKLGRKFEGVKFDADLLFISVNSNETASLNYNGSLGVKVDGKTTYCPFGVPNGSTCISEGSIIRSASITFPASSITKTTNFQAATIVAGAPNPNLLFNPRSIRMNFNLIKHSLIQ